MTILIVEFLADFHDELGVTQPHLCDGSETPDALDLVGERDLIPEGTIDAHRSHPRFVIDVEVVLGQFSQNVFRIDHVVLHRQRDRKAATVEESDNVVLHDFILFGFGTQLEPGVWNRPLPNYSIR